MTGARVAASTAYPSAPVTGCQENVGRASKMPPDGDSCTGAGSWQAGGAVEILVMNASAAPASVDCSAEPRGKSGDRVVPTTVTTPSPLTATPRPRSSSRPTSGVENTILPSESSFETNASGQGPGRNGRTWQVPPPNGRSGCTTGKLADCVAPLTYTLPAASMATSRFAERS